MPIKAVLFDLDDTLAPETSLTRTALTQAADAVRVQHLSPGGLAAGAQLAARQRWQDLRVRGAPRAVATWIDNVGIGSPESLWAKFESGAAKPGTRLVTGTQGCIATGALDRGRRRTKRHADGGDNGTARGAVRHCTACAPETC